MLTLLYRMRNCAWRDTEWRRSMKGTEQRERGGQGNIGESSQMKEVDGVESSISCYSIAAALEGKILKF